MANTTLPWQRKIVVGQHFVCLRSQDPNAYAYATVLRERGVVLTVRLRDAGRPEGHEVDIQRGSLMYPITNEQLSAARKSGWRGTPEAIATIINWKQGGRA